MPKPPADWDDTPCADERPQGARREGRSADRHAGQPALSSTRAPSGCEAPASHGRSPMRLHCGRTCSTSTRPSSWACSMSRRFLFRRRPLREQRRGRRACAAHGRGGRRRSSTSAASRRGRARRPSTPTKRLRRVVPVIEALAARADVPISIDTSKPEVMRAASRAGARMINDVRALREPGALEAAADTRRRGLPDAHAGRAADHAGRARTTTTSSRKCASSCASARSAAWRAGIARDRLVDRSRVSASARRLSTISRCSRGLPALAALGWPVLVGLSRKSMLGALLGRAVDERLAGSVALATAAVLNGARIVRAHDVARDRRCGEGCGRAARSGLSQGRMIGREHGNISAPTACAAASASIR